jgi:HPt (histidine-containing phosphotransfer) domain-containing protein
LKVFHSKELGGVTTARVSQQLDKSATASVIDRVGALSRVEGDGELMASLVDIFFAEAVPMMAALRAALATNDAEKIEKAAHRLKGSVSIFCADAVTQAAFDLEKIGRSGNLANAAETFSRVEQLMAELEPALKQFRAELQPSS